MTDPDAKLEYFKLLLDRVYESGSVYTDSVKHFFLLALVGWIFVALRPADLTLFGMTLTIPQSLISALAPMVLAFLFLRSVSLFEMHIEYRRMAGETARDAISGDNWRIDGIQAGMLLEALFWFNRPGGLAERQPTVFRSVTVWGLWTGIIVGIWIVPVVIIGASIWFLWQEQSWLVAAAVSVVSIVMVVQALIWLVSYLSGSGE